MNISTIIGAFILLSSFRRGACTPVKDSQEWINGFISKNKLIYGLDLEYEFMLPSVIVQNFELPDNREVHIMQKDVTQNEELEELQWKEAFSTQYLKKGSYPYEVFCIYDKVEGYLVYADRTLYLHIGELIEKGIEPSDRRTYYLNHIQIYKSFDEYETVCISDQLGELRVFPQVSTQPLPPFAFQCFKAASEVEINRRHMLRLHFERAISSLSCPKSDATTDTLRIKVVWQLNVLAVLRIIQRLEAKVNSSSKIYLSLREYHDRINREGFRVADWNTLEDLVKQNLPAESVKKKSKPSLGAAPQGNSSSSNSKPVSHKELEDKMRKKILSKTARRRPGASSKKAKDYEKKKFNQMQEKEKNILQQRDILDKEADSFKEQFNVYLPGGKYNQSVSPSSQENFPLPQIKIYEGETEGESSTEEDSARRGSSQEKESGSEDDQQNQKLKELEELKQLMNMLDRGALNMATKKPELKPMYDTIQKTNALVLEKFTKLSKK